MTDQEVKPYIGKPVRVTLADGRILAGVLRASDDHGHGHQHYAVFSRALRKDEPPVRELIHGSDQMTNIEDASGDAAATL
jgi:hypothetical protein